jgi:Helix-turn-helix domain
MSVQAMTWVFEHSSASLGARLVLLAIANHADRDGRNSWASVKVLAEEAHLSERQTRYSLRELERSGEIVDVEVSRNRTHVYELPRMATLFPVSPEGADIAPADSAGGNMRPRRGQNPAVQGAHTAPEPSTNPNSNRPMSINRSFGEFWEAYPRKVGKPKAMLAYKRALKLASSTAILAGAERYRDDANREDEFTAHPTTWLNRAGWDDAPLPARVSQNGRWTDPEPPRPYDHARASDEVRRALAREERNA